MNSSAVMPQGLDCPIAIEARVVRIFHGRRKIAEATIQEHAVRPNSLVAQLDQLRVQIEGFAPLREAGNIDSKYVVNASTLVEHASYFEIVSVAFDITNHVKMALNQILGDIPQIEDVPLMVALYPNGDLIQHDANLRDAGDP